MKLSYRNQRNAEIIAAQYRKPLDKPDWYVINSDSDGEGDSILIYDYIGWPYNDARDFVQAIAGLDLKKVRINSPGGDVFDANAIHNAIKDHPSKPTTIIESLAASAASYIAIAGHKKQAYKNAMIMIHEPMTGMWGNQYELREIADVLQQISENMIDMYADNTNVGKRELKDMLKVETWMKSQIAKDKGFIDEVIQAGSTAKAKFDLSIFSNVPDGMFGEREGRELTEREAERALRDAGGSRAYAKSLIAGRSQVDGNGESDSKDDADKNKVDLIACTDEINKIIKTIKGKV